MKLAIFGGTFDPIHSAHLRMAREAADHVGLNRVLFIPAANPPHKHTGTGYEDRYAMVELACAAAGDARFEASRLEQDQVKSYSILTAERVRAANPGDDVYFIIGADAFAEIESWYRWTELLPLVTFLVVARPGYQYAVTEGAKVLRLDSVAMEISSSEIRRALARGERPSDVPTSVLDYIASRRLYRDMTTQS